MPLKVTYGKSLVLLTKLCNYFVRERITEAKLLLTEFENQGEKLKNV